MLGWHGVFLHPCTHVNYQGTCLKDCGIPGICGSSRPVGTFHWSTCSFREFTSSMSPGTLRHKHTTDFNTHSFLDLHLDWFIYCCANEFSSEFFLIVNSDMCLWSTKAVISSTYICSNSQKYIVWVKIIIFYFMPKIIRILRSCSMKIFSTFSTMNKSKLNFWLVICIAKNYIWTTLKVIFSIFRFFWHPQIPDLQILSDHKNHTSMEIIYSAFRCINLSKKKKMTAFVVQGHIWNIIRQWNAQKYIKAMW